MALPKLFQRIFWYNNTTPAINEDNLNAMSKAIDDIDNRVIVLGDDVITVIPQIQAYLNQAEDLVEAMELLSQNPPYIGQNGNWWVWDTNTSAFVDSGVDASISVNIADITMLAPDAEPYVTNTGTATDPIFHLFIPRGQTGKGISTIAKTGTSGLVDTYTITMTDGTTSTFTVTNGAGDMNKSVYDPTNAIANAGGMKSAATKNSTNVVTSGSTALVESGAVYSSEQNIFEVMGEMGAMNIYNFKAPQGTYTVNGGTVNVDSDGVFTLNGTFSGNASNIYATSDLKFDGKGIFLKAGFYTVGVNPPTHTISKRLELYSVVNGSISIKQYINWETANVLIDSDGYYVLRLYVAAGQTLNNETFKMMICPKTMWEHTKEWQPPCKTNQQLTAETTGLWDNMMDNGAVNYLFNANGSASINQVDFDVDSDNIVTLSGTASSSGARYFIIGAWYAYSGARDFKSGIYRFSGTPKTTPNNDVYMEAGCYDSAGNVVGNNGQFVKIRANEAKSFEVPENSRVVVLIWIPANVNASGLVFKPMLSDPSLNLSYDDYVPYAKSNKELTEDVSVKTNTSGLASSVGTIQTQSFQTVGKITILTAQIKVGSSGCARWSALANWTNSDDTPYPVNTIRTAGYIWDNSAGEDRTIPLAVLPNGQIQPIEALTENDIVGFTVSYIHS